MEYLYVCHFSNGHIKVGRSINPESRIAQHAERVACVGIELIENFFAECVGLGVPAESALIDVCRKNASARNKNEWFDGLSFSEVCEWLEKIANTEFMPPEPWVKKASVKTTVLFEYFSIHPEVNRDDFAQRCNTNKGQIQNVAYGFNSCSPLLANQIEIATNGEVTRSDLRPEDYWLIWPDLPRTQRKAV